MFNNEFKVEIRRLLGAGVFFGFVVAVALWSGRHVAATCASASLAHDVSCRCNR